jgi:NAD(P)-dependent dehydrogenase (short-subunit alcohol dehydrogenase family)
MTLRLEGRTAIVTGAARGDRAALGAAFAKALAKEGAKIVVADIKDTADVADDIMAAGGEALSLRVDVADEAQIKAMIDQTVDRFGRLDILVNNAGIGSNIPPIAMTDLTANDWDRLMAINVRGPFLCVKAAVPQMRKQKYGKIINLGSTTMMTGLTHRLHYVSAKGAILAMTRSLAAELGVDGIRVNAAAFGLVNSPMTEETFKKNPEREAQVLAKRALPIHYRAEDLSGTIIYLASPESNHMTGQCLVVNAGEFFY